MDGLNTSGSHYTSGYYLVKYDYNGVSHHACMRLNLPDPTGTVPRLVVLITGANGDAVTTVEGTETDTKAGGGLDTAAGYLASGAELPAPYTSRYPDAAMTMTFNPPGRGAAYPKAMTLSDGDPDMLDPWATDHPGATQNQVGDDYYGPMGLAALLACIEGALAVSKIYYGTECSRIYVGSFSNGACLAAQLVSGGTYSAYAWVDMEGPTDSFEQTVSAAATANAGLDPLSTTITYADWYAGRSLGSSDIFVQCYAYWYRAPMSVIEELESTYGYDPTPLPGLDGVDITMDDVTEGLAFWPLRQTGDYIARRTCPYIRVQGLNDHVQPSTYRNYHAVRATEAAATAGTDVYYALTPADPILYDPAVVDAGFNDWSNFSTDLRGSLKHPLVDALRWAFSTFG